MKNKLNRLSSLVVFLTIGFAAFSQTNTSSHSLTLGLPEVSLLATQSAGINLTLSSATNAGEAVLSSASDSSAFLQFSSVIAEGSTRTLSASFTGTLPGGTSLKAIVQDPGASASGDWGTPVGSDVTLAATDNVLVNGVGSCYSGTEATDGYRLKYTWGLDNPESNYADIRATASASITVVLTLTAAN